MDLFEFCFVVMKAGASANTGDDAVKTLKPLVALKHVFEGLFERKIKVFKLAIEVVVILVAVLELIVNLELVVDIIMIVVNAFELVEDSVKLGIDRVLTYLYPGMRLFWAVLGDPRGDLCY